MKVIVLASINLYSYVPWTVWFRNIVWSFGFFTYLLLFCWDSFINRPIRLPKVSQLHQPLFVWFQVYYDFWKYMFSKTYLGLCASSFFWIVFRSICSSVSVNTGHTPFPVKYNLNSITVQASKCCLWLFYYCY